MRRAILGIVALFLAVGGGLLYFGALGNNEQAGGVLFKAGLGLLAIWLAMPQLDDLFSSPKGLWLIVIILGGGIVLFYPRAAFILFPIILIMAAIQFVSWLFTPLSNEPKKGTSSSTGSKTTGPKARRSQTTGKSSRK